jgi:hypothetical protein
VHGFTNGQSSVEGKNKTKKRFKKVLNDALNNKC